MAYSGSGNGYLRSASSIPSSENLHAVNTMHCFIRSSVAPGTSNFRNIMELVGNVQNPHEQNPWSHTSAAFSKSRAHRTSGGAYSAAQATSTPAINTWHSWGSQYDGAAKLYVNGVLETTGTAAGASSANAVFVHALAFITFAGALDQGPFPEGDIAELAVWNVALSADEMASLSKGFRADRIRPQSLKFYAPLVRQLNDRVGGRTFVRLAGADAFADHPRVYG
jgi:hypothetical protein